MPKAAHRHPRQTEVYAGALTIMRALINQGEHPDMAMKSAPSLAVQLWRECQRVSDPDLPTPAETIEEAMESYRQSVCAASGTAVPAPPNPKPN